MSPLDPSYNTIAHSHSSPPRLWQKSSSPTWTETRSFSSQASRLNLSGTRALSNELTVAVPNHSPPLSECRGTLLSLPHPPPGIDLDVMKGVIGEAIQKAEESNTTGDALPDKPQGKAAMACRVGKYSAAALSVVSALAFLLPGLLIKKTQTDEEKLEVICDEVEKEGATTNLHALASEQVHWDIQKHYESEMSEKQMLKDPQGSLRQGTVAQEDDGEYVLTEKGRKTLEDKMEAFEQNNPKPNSIKELQHSYSVSEQQSREKETPPTVTVRPHSTWTVPLGVSLPIMFAVGSGFLFLKDKGNHDLRKAHRKRAAEAKKLLKQEKSGQRSKGRKGFRALLPSSPNIFRWV